MRSPAEIRSLILRLRDKAKLPLAVIAERSRCSRHEIITAFTFDASEQTMIRLDAFLDAPKLHKRERNSKLLYKIEKLGQEMYHFLGLKTAHPEKVARQQVWEQELTWERMNWLAKTTLQRKMLADHGLVVKVPDGEPYWLYKERCERRKQRAEAVRTGNGNTDRFPWPCGVGEIR